MPDEDRLPRGPQRRLVEAVHRLYQLACKPPVRTLSEEIKSRDDLPGTLSHEGVSAVLRGTAVPRWRNLESLIRVLAEMAIQPVDVELEVLHVHALWGAVDGVEILPSEQRRPSVTAAGGTGSAARSDGLADPPAVLQRQHVDVPNGTEELPVGDEVPAYYNPKTSMLRMKVTLSRELSWTRDLGEGSTDA